MFFSPTHLVSSPSYSDGSSPNSFPENDLLAWEGDIDENYIFEFIKYCFNLTSLKITQNTKLSWEFFVRLIPYTSNLRKLDLTGSPYVHENNFAEFLSKAVNLEELSLSDCAGFSQLSLLQILTLPKLTTLHLKNQIDPNSPFGRNYIQQAQAKGIQLFL